MNNPKTIIYLRSLGTVTAGGAEHQRSVQLQACTAAAILSGAATRRDKDGEPKLLNSMPMIEPTASSDKVWKQIVSALEPQDMLVIATLGVLGDVPSKLVTNLSKAVGSGAHVVIADMPTVDLGTIRQTALAFMPLEERVERLSSELDAYYANRAEERQQFARDVQKQVLDALYKQGVDLTTLLDPEKKGAKQPDDPVRGRQLRQLREQLEMSGEESGKLLEAIGQPVLTKQAVSAIESGRDTSERADAYETALRAEIAKRKVQAKMDKAIAQKAGMSIAPNGGQPVSEIELKLYGMEAGNV